MAFREGMYIHLNICERDKPIKGVLIVDCYKGHKNSQGRKIVAAWQFLRVNLKEALNEGALRQLLGYV